MRFCLCINERNSVKSVCPVHILTENDEIFKYLIQMFVYLSSFTVCFSGDIEEERKALNENYQSTGHFQTFFSSP